MAETRRLQGQLKRFHLEKVKIGPRFANVELRFRDADRQAAWGALCGNAHPRHYPTVTRRSWGRTNCA